MSLELKFQDIRSYAQTNIRSAYAWAQALKLYQALGSYTIALTVRTLRLNTAWGQRFIINSLALNDTQHLEC